MGGEATKVAILFGSFDPKYIFGFSCKPVLLVMVLNHSKNYLFGPNLDIRPQAVQCAPYLLRGSAQRKMQRPELELAFSDLASLTRRQALSCCVVNVEDERR